MIAMTTNDINAQSRTDDE